MNDHSCKSHECTTLGNQVGGEHYLRKGIQPWEYIEANDLDFWEGNVIKYITRWKDKGGVLDLQKAQHYLNYLIDRECGLFTRKTT